MLTFTYTWKHIPSGKHGEGRADALNQTDFLLALNVWNCSDDWHYQSLDPKVWAGWPDRVAYVTSNPRV